MPYDAQATRERILSAATIEFAAHGVAGARVDRIAAAAGANKRAIYDYYGDKESLFAAVLERELIDCAESVPLDGDLADYAARLFDYQADRPAMLRLLMWEALEFGDRAPVPGEAERAEKYARRAEALAERQPNVDPRATLLMLMGMVNWGFAIPQLRRMVLGPDFSPERLRQELIASVSSMVR